MRLFLSCLLFLSFTAVSQAQSTYMSRFLPPEPYRRGPTGPVKLVKLPDLDTSWKACMDRGVGGGSTACSFYSWKVVKGKYSSLCTIYYSDPGDLPHELGHCRVKHAGGPNGHEGWH